MFGMAMAWLLGTLVTPAEQPEAVRLARAALARDVGRPDSEIQAESVESVQWPDASLGCPEKGMTYAQLLTHGYRVALRIGGERYIVHVANGRAVVCSPPRSAPTSPGREALGAAARLSREARRDLAVRLKISEEAVAVRAVRPKVWPDAGLGCPSEGMVYASVRTPGFAIELDALGRSYEYHADHKRVVPCGPVAPVP